MAYLRRAASGWRLERRWDELAWIGDTGGPADAIRSLSRRNAPPLVFATRQSDHQGERTERAWAFELAPDGPRLVSFFPLGRGDRSGLARLYANAPG